MDGFTTSYIYIYILDRPSLLLLPIRCNKVKRAFCITCFTSYGFCQTIGFAPFKLNKNRLFMDTILQREQGVGKANGTSTVRSDNMLWKILQN